MLYAMIAKDAPGTADKRTATRPVHLDHLSSLGTRLRFAGALLDASGTPEGSLLVYEADTIEEATAALEADPFIKAGIFGSWEIKAWRVAFDNYGKD